MSRKETYGFTLDLKNLVKLCLLDPTTKKMVFDAIREDSSKVSPVHQTTPLGASNLKENKEDPDEWYSSFLGTSTLVSPGQDGFILRNLGGTGPRVSIRLKRQEVKQHLAQTPAEVLPPSTVTQPTLAVQEPVLQQEVYIDL